MNKRGSLLLCLLDLIHSNMGVRIFSKRSKTIATLALL